MDRSLFVADEPEPRTVTLADGSTHTLHFKASPAKLWRRYSLADAKADNDEWESAAGNLIAATVCEPDGTQSMTVEDALRLKPFVTVRLLQEIAAVNGAAGKT